MLTNYKLVSGKRTGSLIRTDDATASSHNRQPKFRLAKSKTKLIKVERKFSIKRAAVAKMVKALCDENGIEYPNKV